jgi:opacity protein-like surface antigen
MTRILTLFVLVSTAAVCQPISVGVKGGVPFGDAFTFTGGKLTVPTNTAHWIIGPMVELHLPLGLSVEADALYRSYQISETGSEWQFPILGKYKFLAGPVRPYVGAGVNFNHVSGFPKLVTGTIPHATAAGFSLEGGVEFKLLRLRLAPELRFTHWGNPNIDLNPINIGLKSSQNQAMVLVGLSF